MSNIPEYNLPSFIEDRDEEGRHLIDEAGEAHPRVPNASVLFQLYTFEEVPFAVHHFAIPKVFTVEEASTVIRRFADLINSVENSVSFDNWVLVHIEYNEEGGVPGIIHSMTRIELERHCEHLHDTPARTFLEVEGRLRNSRCLREFLARLM